MQSARQPDQSELDLYDRAVAVREHAYAPWSSFAVGAALRFGDDIVVGTNFENDSFGLTICAERGAIGTAIAQGIVHRAVAAGAKLGSPQCLDAVAISAEAKTVSPCGACRQVLMQFAHDQTRVIYPRNHVVESVLLTELLTDAFELS